MRTIDEQGMRMLRFDNAPKKATNLSLNTKVLEMARELGMNVSQTVDALLAKEVERVYWEQWKERNKDAIEDYNARIRGEGIWGAKYRTFARSLGDGRVADEDHGKKKAA
jgi:antitoxin CcdA